MRALSETIRRFILTVRRSNETTKRRWVYLLSGTAILLILVLWIGYLNLSLPKIAPPADVVATETTPTTENASNSFFGVLGRGFKKLGGDLWSGLSSMGDTFSETFRSARKSFGGTVTDIEVGAPLPEESSAPLFIDLNGTSSPTSSPLLP